MPVYHRLGELPRKRHQVAEGPHGSMLFEELMGNKGFVGPSSLLYHLRYPTDIRELRSRGGCAPHGEPVAELRARHFRTGSIEPSESPVLDRRLLLFNEDVRLSFVRPEREDDFFYRNGQADELVYVVAGEGVLHSQMGRLPVRAGDYVVIPRGIVHRWSFEGADTRLLIVECRGQVSVPRHYRNEFGQLLEGAPFNERDLRRPEALEVHDEVGEFSILTRQHDQWTEQVLPHHPFDVVGWDGYYYPWALSIHDFEPKVAAYHLPPPVHQTFAADGVVICSFCPRPFDFGPGAIPAPYFHSNVWSDEVLFYASSEFMSRKGIEFGSITLHPDGQPHGPHPGRMEDSIGKTWTDELAVMVDTFRPLRVAEGADSIEDPDYWKSWQSEKG